MAVKPTEGDVVLRCIHLGEGFSGRAHWYSVHGDEDKDGISPPDEVDFIRPDGSTGAARWFVICDYCHMHQPPPETPIGGEEAYCDDTFGEIKEDEKS